MELFDGEGPGIISRAPRRFPCPLAGDQSELSSTRAGASSLGGSSFGFRIPRSRVAASTAAATSSPAPPRAASCMPCTKASRATSSTDSPRRGGSLAEKQLEGRDGLAEGMFGVDPKGDPEKARVVGQFTQALLAGVMVQWMVDPETAPSAQDLRDGLRAIIGDDLA